MALFNVSVAGLRRQVTRLEVSSNNLANSITPGFKSSRVDQVEIKGQPSITVNFSQGPLEFTGDKFSLAVLGNGLFQLDSPQGTRFTRAGVFNLDRDGFITHQSGLRLSPQIQVPTDSEVMISANGVISTRTGNSTTQIGQISISRFANPEGLVQEGNSLFSLGSNSGTPISGSPGQNGLGTIAFGVLEQSNVDLPSEMVSMIVSKALAKVNVAAIRTQDQILGEIIDISR